MKVFMLQAADPLETNHHHESYQVLKRNYFNSGEERDFLKSYIINADSQMQSLINSGIEIDYGYLGERKSLRSLIASGKKLRKICKGNKIDLVHVLWGSVTSLMATLFSPVPVLISFSGSDLLGTVDANGRTTQSGMVSRFFSQVSALFAIQLITKSEHMKSNLWGLSRKKCTVIPNGIDLSGFYEMNKGEARKKVGWENEMGKIVLFMNGSGAVVKNLPLALKTVEEVKKKISNVSFKVLENASFDQMKYYYNASDVMLLTSFHEGSCNAIKEARACNLPIVSVDCGDSKERLKNVSNSFVTQTYSPQELASKIIEVLNSGERGNGANFSDEVSIENIAKRVISVYQKALNNK